MKLTELKRWLDDYLVIDGLKDASLNGLQVEGSDTVTRVACAVDTSLAGIQQALERGAELMFVHHGLFWGRPWRVVGHYKARLKALFEGDLSLYAAHLPLDAHPEVGNNAVVLRGLGASELEPFGRLGRDAIGWAATLEPAVSIDELCARLARVVGGPVSHIGAGPDAIRRVGVITGAAARSVEEAAAFGLDAFITGETDHASYHVPFELGIHLLFGGHYQTETVGPRAMMDKLAATFPELETFFIDHPTGM